MKILATIRFWPNTDITAQFQSAAIVENKKWKPAEYTCIKIKQLVQLFKVVMFYYERSKKHTECTSSKK